MKVSIVIATRNKSASLQKVLTTLTFQKEKDFEVHVVNDGGTFETEELCHSFQDRLQLQHHWSVPSNAESMGAAKARNVGIRRALASRLLIVDDDCLCPNDVVAVHAELGNRMLSYIGFRRHVDVEVHKRLTPAQLADVKSVPSKPEMRARPEHLQRMSELCRKGVWQVQSYLWTCHISYPTSVIKKIGGMWEEMKGSGAEDCEFGLRAWRAGVRYQILHDPSVWHMDHPQSSLQIEHLPNNRKLFFQTRDTPGVIVRNGGPLQ